MDYKRLVKRLRISGDQNEYGAKPTALYLCTTSLCVWDKPLTTFAVLHIIASDPLISILTALRANACNASTPSKIKLEPRVSDTTPRAPCSTVPSHAPLTQPSVSWCTVVVVE